VWEGVAQLTFLSPAGTGPGGYLHSLYFIYVIPLSLWMGKGPRRIILLPAYLACGERHAQS
jgi:hypothetical protein